MRRANEMLVIYCNGSKGLPSGLGSGTRRESRCTVITCERGCK
jgi:hypothetical protein